MQLRRFPASSVTKKLALIPFPTSNLAWYVRMYVCTTDEMTVTFSYLPPLTPSLCKSIVVPYVEINAKVTNFFPFCTMELVCTKNVFYPILLFPLLSHPKLLPLWSVPDRRRNLNTPLSLTSFFFPLSARGPTRRRNSTGLAELWGGWPIELDNW